MATTDTMVKNSVDKSSESARKAMDVGEKFMKNLDPKIYETVSSAANTVKDEIQNVSSRTADVLQKTSRDAWKGAQTLYGDAVKFARNRPVAASLIAAGAGIIIGAIIKKSIARERV